MAKSFIKERINNVSGYCRLPTVKQSLCALPKTDTLRAVQRRSRRFSMTGSHVKKASVTRGVSSATTTTLEAKLIAGMIRRKIPSLEIHLVHHLSLIEILSFCALVSSEGGTVECYAKATLPRQSTTTTPTISVQKSSKRWM